MTNFTYIPNDRTVYIRDYKRTLAIDFINNLTPEKLQNIFIIDTKEDVPMDFILALKGYCRALN